MVALSVHQILTRIMQTEVLHRELKVTENLMSNAEKTQNVKQAYGGSKDDQRNDETAIQRANY